MKKRPLGCLGYMRDYFLNQSKDPVIKQQVFHGKYPAVSFFRGSGGKFGLGASDSRSDVLQVFFCADLEIGFGNFT